MSNHTRDHIIKMRKKFIHKRMNVYDYVREKFDYLNDPNLSDWEKKMEETTWSIHYRTTKDPEVIEKLKNDDHIIIQALFDPTVYFYRSNYPRYRKRKFMPGYLSKNRSYMTKKYYSGKTKKYGYGIQDTKKVLSMNEELNEFYNEECWNSNQILRNIKYDKDFNYHD